MDDDALGRQSDEDDGDGEQEDEDNDDDIEDALEAMLENAAGLVGRKRKKKSKKRKGKMGAFGGDDDDSSDSSDDDEEAKDLANDALANARYEDFFGGTLPGSNTKSRKTKGGGKVPTSDAPRLRNVLAEDYSSSGDEEEEEFEDDDDDGRAEEEVEEEEEEEENDGQPSKSSHQRKLERTATRIRALEHEAMAEKPWFLQGEVIGGARPKNSALEIDLDFETTVKPPPAPTEESTRTLEDLIKARIAEAQFDDPIKIAPVAVKETKTVIELDDKKSNAGLGELYERDYVAAVTGAVEDKDAPVRETAVAQFKILAAALDALSHGHYRPVPSIQEVTVKVDVPAIMMEEAAPAFVSAASMRAPEEVYKRGQGGQEMVKADGELTREERKRRRAGKKRAGKKRKAATEEERKQKVLAQGKEFIAGRKSEEEAKQLEAMKKKASALGGSGAGGNGLGNYSKSTQVFGQLQAGRERQEKEEKERPSGHNASGFKL